MAGSVKGTTDPRFARVREAFAASFALPPEDPDAELGAALCAIVDGKTVIDLCGGFADVARSHEWSPDTRACVMSATKAWTALVVQLLIQERHLSLDRRLAELWPEFGIHGKSPITVAHVLDHTAGLPIVDSGTRNLRFEQQSWERALISATPLHPSGERRIYHAITQGYLLNALIRRVTGKGVAEIFHQRFAKPLGLDLSFGVETGALTDLCEVGSVAPGEAVTPTQIAVEALRQAMDPPDFNAPDFVRGVVPAANGIATARSLAKLYASLIDPTQSPLSAHTLAAATALRWEGAEEMGSQVWRMASGLMLSNAFAHFGPNPNAFGHPGRGGATGFADPERRLAIAYLPNRPDPRFGSSGRFAKLLTEILDAL